MIRITVFIFIAMILGCDVLQQDTLEIGQHINQDRLIKEEMSVIMTSSASFDTSFVYKLDNLKYRIVLNDNSDVTFIMTSDTAFITEEGIKVGAQLDYLQNTLKLELKKEPGWAYYCELASGWKAVILTDDSFGLPANDALVGWFFKK